MKYFAKITKSLTICLKKGAKITHSPAFLKYFHHLKYRLINAPILKYPDLISLHFTVNCEQLKFERLTLLKILGSKNTERLMSN